jgi:two-component system, response regulator
MKTVLLVDDDIDDIFLMNMACQRSGFPHALQTAHDGIKAISYLSGEGEFADRSKHPLPILVFLDIKMPKMDGHEVLQWIRGQSQFVNLPVIMLTTSLASDDVQRAYSLGANSYLRKGDDLIEFGQGVRLVLKYWLEMNHSGVPKSP